MATILIIEDDLEFNLMLKDLFQLAGYTTLEATNGKGGINLFRQNPVDIVITDLIMPEKEGIETILELQKEFPEVKIIAISGGGEMGSPDIYLTSALNLGAKRAFTKPLDCPKLLNTVKELLAE